MASPCPSLNKISTISSGSAAVIRLSNLSFSATWIAFSELIRSSNVFLRPSDLTLSSATSSLSDFSGLFILAKSESTLSKSGTPLNSSCLVDPNCVLKNCANFTGLI